MWRDLGTWREPGISSAQVGLEGRHARIFPQRKSSGGVLLMKDEWVFGGGEAQKDITVCAVCMHRGVAGRLGPCALGTGSVWRKERKREKCRGPALIPRSRASATSFPFCVPPTLPTRGGWSKAWALPLPKDQPLPPLLQEIIKTLPRCAPAPVLPVTGAEGGWRSCFHPRVLLPGHYPSVSDPEREHESIFLLAVFQYPLCLEARGLLVLCVEL